MQINFVIILLFFSCLNGFSQKEIPIFQHENLIIYKDSVYFKDKELYNAKKDLAALTVKEKSEECDVDYEFYYHPLSLLGDFYSYESGEGGILACGVPSNSLSVQSIDFNTKKPASLTEFFTEESILKALKEDAWIKQLEKDSKTNLQSITNFEDFLNQLNRLNYAEFKINSFAIMQYDNKLNKVAVRFVGSAYMGFNHHQHLQLGIWLTPKKEYKKLFKNKLHFTINDFENGLRK